MTNKVKDLFNHIELLPEKVQSILDRYSDGDIFYAECEELLKELKPYGLTFDYSLDGEPTNLRYEQSKVWTDTFGHVYVAYGSSLYNGYTIEEIEDKVNSYEWNNSDKKKYIENCRAVIKSQLAYMNAGLIESRMNANFNITLKYLTKN